MSLAVDKSSSQKVKILGDTGLVHLHVWGKKKLLVTQKRYYLFIDKNSRDHIKAFDKAILKKLSVGGNPSCCNLEALLEKFFQVFLRFTKIYFNDTH